MPNSLNFNKSAKLRRMGAPSNSRSEPTFEVVAVYYRQRFCLLTLTEFGRILLDIAEPVRGKLREKLRRIEREQYSLLETARAP